MFRHLLQGSRASLLVMSLAAVAAVGLGSSCTPPPPVDAGPVGEGEGEGEGEGQAECRTEGQTCIVAANECCDANTCVPSALNPSRGTCRQECAVRDASGAITGDDPALCAAPRTCQTLFANDLATVTGIVCLPQQTARDGACDAVTDADACSDGRGCELTDFTQDAATGAITVVSANCKDECLLGAADADAACTSPDRCFAGLSPFLDVALTDPTDPATRIACTDALCGDDGVTGPDCPCVGGYSCTTLGDNTQTCARQQGNCGTAVDFADFNDLSQDSICNGVEAHRYCDQSRFAGLPTPGNSECVTGVATANPNDGLCFAICHSPAIDSNNNGALDPGTATTRSEEGADFTCPADYVCNLDLGRDRLVAAAVTDPAGPFEVKECVPANCLAGPGLPCPEECGPGDTECVTFNSSMGELSLCLAPFGNCEPGVVTPPVDGGPAVDSGPATDSGPAPEDSGPAPEDSGPAPVDSGPADSGPADSGPADSGVTPPTAHTAFAIVNDQLVSFTDEATTTLTTPVAITGLVTLDIIVGMDFRPLTGVLFAVGGLGHVYTLNTTTGVATEVTAAAFTPALTGTSFGTDFNPKADRLRIIGNDGQNLLFNPLTNAIQQTDANLAYAALDVNAGTAPNVNGIGYDTNTAGAATTTIFGIDVGTDAVVTVGSRVGVPNAPASGILNTVGALGVDASGVAGFDVDADGTALATLTVAGVTGLYDIDLLTGAATLLGVVGDGTAPISSFAIAP